MTSLEFNEKYPIGTKVIIGDAFGKLEETVTRSEAWELCGTPVVMVEGKAGGYDLEYIEAIE